MSKASEKQARSAKGNQGVRLSTQYLKHFWTITCWEHKEYMQDYMRQGSHLEAMRNAKDLASMLKSTGFEAEHQPNWKDARAKLLQDSNSDKTARYIK